MPSRYMPYVTPVISMPATKTMQPRRTLLVPSVAQQPESSTKIAPPYS